LLRLLALEDCWFTPDEHVDVPVIAPDGRLDLPVLRYRRGGFELPQPAVAIAVHANGRTLGHVVCVPLPQVGIGIERRREAAAIAAGLAAAVVQRHPEVRSIHT
jgi:hypothetical protein